jgi:hypothetical protein
MHLRQFFLASAISMAALPAVAQWLDYPTANVPKTKDGKPDLAAPAPRLNGHPDFSGMWGWDAIQPCGAKCNDNQISTEFINIASKLVAIGGEPVATPGRGAGPDAGAGRGGGGAVPGGGRGAGAAGAGRGGPGAAAGGGAGRGAGGGGFAGFGGGAQLPYTEWGRATMQERLSAGSVDDPNVHCMPRGLPRLWTDDYYKRIYMVPDAMLMLNERNMQYRQIHLDGRPLPADPNPTWNGYSTAEWDGDTLVVHSNGFRDDLWLDSNGNPLTSSGKVTERISRPNFGTLMVEMTIEDPKAYTKPWTVRIPVPLVLDSDLIDYYCLENEKDAFHMGSSWTKTPAK